jgi:hypothetical protein
LDQVHRERLARQLFSKPYQIIMKGGPAASYGRDFKIPRLRRQAAQT